MEPPPPLPRPPADEENLRRLRREAAERLRHEAAGPPVPAPVYGGPPVIPRRWTVRGILMLFAGILAAIAAALFGYRKIAPVYGGPPAPVYGGPPPSPPVPRPDPPR